MNSFGPVTVFVYPPPSISLVNCTLAAGDFSLLEPVWIHFRSLPHFKPLTFRVEHVDVLATFPVGFCTICLLVVLFCNFMKLVTKLKEFST